jgi:hypothetical protein
MTSRRLGAFAMAVTLAGCASPTTGPRPVETVRSAPVVVPAEGYSAQFPRGWGLIDGPPHRKQATRAGANLSRVTFEFLRPDQLDSKAFDGLPALSPGALAEHVLALEGRSRDPLDVRLESIQPATLGGCAGFRAELAHEVPGLRYRRVVYGWGTNRGLYMLTYDAPALHYFAQDLAAFEAIAASVAPGDATTGLKCATPAR